MEPRSQSTQGMGNGLVAEARGLGGKAADRLHSEVDSRKGMVTEQARSVSTTVQRLADDLDPQTPSWLRSGIEQGSAQLQKLADALEQKDSRQLVRDVTEFARTSPAIFLGACAAAGFAAARVLKAGAETASQSQPEQSGFVDQQTASTTFDDAHPQSGAFVAGVTA